jgi:hypothetical protein
VHWREERISSNIFAVGDEVSIADLSMPMSAVGPKRRHRRDVLTSEAENKADLKRTSQPAVAALKYPLLGLGIRICCLIAYLKA